MHELFKSPAPLIIYIILLSTFLYNPVTFAAELESPEYRIDNPTIDIAEPKIEPQSYTLANTKSQLALQEFESKGYIIETSNNNASLLGIGITKSNVSLGTLKSNVPSTGITTIEITTKDTNGYQLTAQEETPLQSLSGESIADTSCDGKELKCTPFKAQPWTNDSASGFGYTVSGNSIASDFISTSFFRPFANKTLGLQKALLSRSDETSNKDRVDITYKAITSQVQTEGTYQTAINFILTPLY